MIYSIRETKDGCVEKLEINGQIFVKRSKKTSSGYMSLDPDLKDQMRASNISEDIIHVASGTFDNVTTLNFLKLIELNQ